MSNSLAKMIVLIALAILAGATGAHSQSAATEPLTADTTGVTSDSVTIRENAAADSVEIEIPLSGENEPAELQIDSLPGLISDTTGTAVVHTRIAAASAPQQIKLNS